ncbi:MAG TPA: hypothetical protein PLO61_00925 [Fimbriimonadaceae bacterium]|nr:hypothetical protein [Fimbriimonadaceae bacterium]HRJ32462.1 hypothetical protein [Fimbriimonadaceae bacterium]
MKFYNLKLREHVEVDDSKVVKTKMIRKTKNGEQTRYAFRGDSNGVKVWKFVSEKDYKAAKFKEE